MLSTESIKSLWITTLNSVHKRQNRAADFVVVLADSVVVYTETVAFRAETVAVCADSVVQPHILACATGPFGVPKIYKRYKKDKKRSTRKLSTGNNICLTLGSNPPFFRFLERISFYPFVNLQDGFNLPLSTFLFPHQEEGKKPLFQRALYQVRKPKVSRAHSRYDTPCF